MTVFDVIQNISNGNDVLFTQEEIEQYYNPYFVLDFFSKFEDTIFIANDLNCFKSSLSKYNQYLYLHTMIRKKKRNYRNFKKDMSREEKIRTIMEYFECSRDSAIKDMLPLLTDINITDMKKHLTDVGGVIK